MSEKLYSYKDAVETSGSDTGRVKDKDVAWEMAHAEKKYQDKRSKKDSFLGDMGLVNYAKLEDQAEGAANAAAEEEIKRKATESYLKAGYRPEAAGAVAAAEAEKNRQYPDIIKREEERQLQELRKKINSGEGSDLFSTDNLIYTEGENVGRVRERLTVKEVVSKVSDETKQIAYSDAVKNFPDVIIGEKIPVSDYSFAQEMAEIENKYREKGWRYRLRWLWEKFLGKDLKKDIYSEQVKKGQSKADQLVEKTLQEKAKASYQAVGYRDKPSEQFAEEQKDRYRTIEEKTEEEVAREKKELGEKIKSSVKRTRTKSEGHPASHAGHEKAGKTDEEEPKKQEQKKKDKHELSYDERIERIPLAFRPLPGTKLSEEELKNLEYLVNVPEADSEAAIEEKPEEKEKGLFSDAQTFDEVYNILRENDGLENDYGRHEKADYWINIIELNRGTSSVLSIDKITENGGLKSKILELLKTDRQK